MYDNKRSAGKKWRNALIAAALTASMILALPAWTVRPAEARSTEKLDTSASGTCTLTIKRAGTEPAKQGAIKVDLYKVADATVVSGYDAYKLDLSDEKNERFLEFYGDGIKDVLDGTAEVPGVQDPSNNNTVSGNSPNDKDAPYSYNARYRELAQMAARRVLAPAPNTGETVSGNDIAGRTEDVAQYIYIGEVTINGEESKKFSELEHGLYLVIAHGADLTAAQYIGNKDGQLVTMAYNKGYAYSFLPELISLPIRGNDEQAPQGIFSTAQSAGDWQYDVTAELKAEETVRMHDLTIEKDFGTLPAGAVVTGNDGCVYRIDAVLNGQTVYSKVVAISYKGTHSVTLPQVIPEGATVTVTEVYDGASFDIVVPEGGTAAEAAKKTVALGDDGVYRASFTNSYNNTSNGGGIVVNTFKKNDKNEYNWGAVSGNDLNPQPQQ